MKLYEKTKIFLLGFIAAILLFIFINSKTSSPGMEIGRYQISIGGISDSSGTSGTGGDGMACIGIIDTATGKYTIDFNGGKIKSGKANDIFKYIK